VIEVSDALAKLQTLSEERLSRVVSLIEDLAELQARENAEDLVAAHESLAEYRIRGEAVSLDDLEKRLGV
jgi:hypothetical protein